MFHSGGPQVVGVDILALCAKIGTKIPTQEGCNEHRQHCSY